MVFEKLPQKITKIIKNIPDVGYQIIENIKIEDITMIFKILESGVETRDQDDPSPLESINLASCAGEDNKEISEEEENKMWDEYNEDIQNFQNPHRIFDKNIYSLFLENVRGFYMIDIIGSRVQYYKSDMDIIYEDLIDEEIIILLDRLFDKYSIVESNKKNEYQIGDFNIKKIVPYLCLQ